LVHQPLHVLAVVTIIVIGKSLAAFALVLLFRYPLNTALTVSAGLAQIGEFSFILVGMGVSLKLLPPEGQSFILAGAIISIAVNPLLFRAIEPAQAWIRARSKLAQALERPGDPLAVLPMTVELTRLTDHVVLVGYGRIARRIGAALTANGIPFVVAEENRDIVEELRAGDTPAVSGDAADPAVLIQAHIHRARMLVITATDPVKIRQIIGTARTVNPRAKALLCAQSEEEAALLERDHVGKVYLGEQELARSIIKDLIDRYAGTTGHHF
jgi:CPA2 family monovalent cation:H+ antiporter-2